ncbi:MAG TPA: HAD family hydrolase [Ruminococcaceae bacterium]|nr:HAD family hydrolase [Oscillospiraceae bacterium]
MALNDFNNIKWLFFDIGSTLVDESKCYERRYLKAIENTDITYDELLDKVIAFSRQNKNGDHPAIEYFGLELPKWDNDLEYLYDDTSFVLSELSKKYNIGIIANQSLGTEQRLEKMGILNYIDLVVASAEEGIAKPNPDIFRIALSKAQCDAQSSVMIGDRIDNDIVPAKAVGMRTIWIKQGFAQYQEPKNDFEKADFAVNELSQLLKIL